MKKGPVHAQIDTEELRKRLSKLAQKVSDFRPAWPKIDKYTTLVYQRQFASEGAFLLGRRWKGWTPKWAKRRPRPGGNRGGIGRDTARMWASFTKAGAPESIRRFDRLQYQRGSVVAYAQHFTKLRPVHPDPLPKTVENVYLRLLTDYIEKAAA